MPKCIDDPSRSYKGNEPSPKGLGYCAHTQAVGTSKTGNDGNTWTVETTYKGTKRWVKKSGSGKRRSPKKTSKRKSPKRKTSPAKKVSGTACTKLPTMTGYDSSLSNSEHALEPGQTYYLHVLGIDITEDKDYEKIYNKMVYNRSTFKKKMEKLLCTWTKGKKVTVTEYELYDMDPYNTHKSASITILWKH